MQDKPSAARLRAELTGVLIGLTRAADDYNCTEETYSLFLQGLKMSGDPTRTKQSLTGMIRAAHEEKHRLVPNCAQCSDPCGRTEDYDMALLQKDGKAVASLKVLLLYTLCHFAHTGAENLANPENVRILMRVLFVVGEELEAEQMLPYLQELGNLIRTLQPAK